MNSSKKINRIQQNEEIKATYDPTFKAAVPLTFWHQEPILMEDSFSTGGMCVEGWFQNDASVLHLLCNFCFCCYYIVIHSEIIM